MAGANLDKYKVPAFRRKASIKKGADKPLLLTALARRRAGIPIIPKPKKRRPVRRSVSRRTVRYSGYSAPDSWGADAVGFEAPLISEPSTPAYEPLSARESGPISAPARMEDGQEFSYIGKMTHYFDRIRVGVIQLEASLRVGDYILFETEEGLYVQTVSSMQYNKKDITLGRVGMDIGLKIAARPMLGGKVYKS